MPCVKIGNGFICGPKIFRYQGYYFEWHSYCGPCPLRKDGKVSAKIPTGFWEMIDAFISLSEEEKDKYREMQQ